MGSSASRELPQFKGRPGWEFTDISGLDLAAYRPVSADQDTATAPEPLFAPQGANELAPGVVVTRIADAPAELIERYLGSVVTADDVFTTLNDSAEYRSGWLVYVPPGTVLEQPISLQTVQPASGTMLHQRTLIVLDQGAQAEVWEQYLSAQADLDGVVNVITELVVGDGARLRYVCGQSLSERSWIFGAQRAELARDACLDWVALGFGSARGRVRMETRLGGPGAAARVTGAYASRGRQHIDFDTTQELSLIHI